MLLTGATGFIGSAVVEALRQRGDEVYRLIRPPQLVRSNEIVWNPAENFLDKSKLRRCDAIIHLAGENLYGRWTENKKRRVYQSRIKGSQLLVDYIAEMDRRPRVLISASGVGYYGDRGETSLTEESPMGEGFLAEVSRDWEAACREAEKHTVRTVQMRFGMVLSTRGGALPKMLPPFSLHLGGPLGSGRQYMPWVALADAVGAILFALDNGRLKGPVNVVSPTQVTNAEFSRTLARTMGRKCFLRVPAFVLKAVFGQLARELLLSSTCVVPRKLMDAGYAFKYAGLAPCLEAALAEEE
ncbi:MAG: TIGR01777 family protein [Phycisphaerae bacterium]|nr:TIGR01777 family protein [Phycisphaerae bacterium]